MKVDGQSFEGQEALSLAGRFRWLPTVRFVDRFRFKVPVLASRVHGR